MKIPFVDLKSQYSSIKPAIDKAIKEVVENTDFIGGKTVQEFQLRFQNVYGVKYCVPLGNGTDAIYIAMKMMGIGAGDEVITTASSWISTSETISQTGARPVFVDIDEFYTIDVARIEEKITSKTRAIIPVHLYGQMADMPKIIEIAKRYKLKVIEDCAQSHFSEINGKRAGLWGDCGTFSFYPGKNLGAYGDAGCLITNEKDFANRCRMYANHGALIKHHHEIEGVNSRLDGIQAAVLSAKLPYIVEWTEKRNAAAKLYSQLLAEIPDVQLPQLRENSLHSFHIFGVKIKERDRLKSFLLEKGISTQVHYPNALPFMPAYSYQKANIADYPKSFDLQEKELSLPIFPEMTDSQIEYICSCIKTFYKSN